MLAAIAITYFTRGDHNAAHTIYRELFLDFKNKNILMSFWTSGQLLKVGLESSLSCAYKLSNVFLSQNGATLSFNEF
jgi:hypothetical protein